MLGGECSEKEGFTAELWAQTAAGIYSGRFLLGDLGEVT